MKWSGEEICQLYRTVIECLANHSYGKADGVVSEPVGVRSGPFPGHTSVMRGKKKPGVDCGLKCA